MKLRAETVVQEALTLPEEERAEIAGALLESLDSAEDSGIEAAWRQEVAARVAALDKSSCFARAKKMLSLGDGSLRYACLELRFCMEAMAYDKLNTYSKRLPSGLLERWQPPQAVRALLELEPDADQDFELRMSLESAPGVPTGEWVNLGSHKSLKLDWLRKHYNKLGNFLHVPLPSTKPRSVQHSSGELRQYLEEVVAEMEPVVVSTMDASFAAVVTFQCSVCKEMVPANLAGVQKSHKAVCLSPQCGAEFIATNKGNELVFDLDASYPTCIKCDHQNAVENRKLAIGYRFRCEECGEEHKVARWGYALVK